MTNEQPAPTDLGATRNVVLNANIERKGFIMIARLSALLLLILLAAVGSAFAQQYEENEGITVAALNIRAPEGGFIEQIHYDEFMQNGWKPTAEVTIQHRLYGEANLPEKYFVSWKSGKRWLKANAANPKHKRRGNIWVAGGQDVLTFAFTVKMPAGKDLDVRVRPHYADGKTGEECLLTIDQRQWGFAVDDDAPLPGWLLVVCAPGGIF